MKQEKHGSHPTWVKHHRRRNILVLVMVTGILAAVVLGVSFLSSSVGARVGQQAPDFTAQDINNNVFHLYGHKGTPMLVELMRTTCSHCMNEAPTLASLWSNHQSQMVFVSISTSGDSPSMMMSFAQSYHQSWTMAQDLSGITGTYGVTGTPTMFLLDRNCIVKYSFQGETSLQTLENAVQSLL